MKRPLTDPALYSHRSLASRFVLGVGLGLLLADRLPQKPTEGRRVEDLVLVGAVTLPSRSRSKCWEGPCPACLLVHRSMPNRPTLACNRGLTEIFLETFFRKGNQMSTKTRGYHHLKPRSNTETREGHAEKPAPRDRKSARRSDPDWLRSRLQLVGTGW